MGLEVWSVHYGGEGVATIAVLDSDDTSRNASHIVPTPRKQE